MKEKYPLYYIYLNGDTMHKYIKKIKKQETYLGEQEKGNYFEGWYFKLVTNDKKNTIAFIIGITKGEDEHAFIQVIDTVQNKPFYFRYTLKDFVVSENPFSIQIGPNLFSLKKIILDIKDIHLKGTISFKELLPIHKSIYSPNIMGPFAYLFFLECNHGVISLGHLLEGKINIHHKKINFNNGIGYIEKDYGSSFPKRYIWMQANKSKDTNFFLSIATIPFKIFSFKGLISILMIEGKEYRFATYNGTKLLSLENIDAHTYFIKMKKKDLYLEIFLRSGHEIPLVSPKKGHMNDKVEESLESTIHIKLRKKEKILWEESFSPCTTEILW